MTPKIHVFSAPADKFFVNSFIVETASALVVVDTQFLVSTATALRAAVVALEKPVEAIIITHPHPDHFNGLPILIEGMDGVPVMATQATVSGMKETQAAKRAAWTPVYGDDYPTTDRLPDVVLDPGEALSLGGTTIHMVDLGPGESSDITIVLVPEANALIASDLVYARCHPWLAEHRSEQWLAQLARVDADYTSFDDIYPGHGPRSDRRCFADQRDYIVSFKDIVGRHLTAGGLDDAAIEAISIETRRGRDGWPLEGLIALNAKAIAEEILK